MWPKAFSQLVELAPHVTRLLPMADRFFKDKAAGEDATRRALDAHRQATQDMVERLRLDIGQISTQNLGLQKQIIDVEKHLSGVQGDALAAREAAEAMTARVAGIEARQARLSLLLVAILVALLPILVLLVLVYVRGR